MRRKPPATQLRAAGAPSGAVLPRPTRSRARARDQVDWLWSPPWLVPAPLLELLPALLFPVWLAALLPP